MLNGRKKGHTVYILALLARRRERVADSVLVGVEEDALVVVVSCAAVRLEGEDVLADCFVEGEVRGIGR
jgi:hypothetical protein